MCLVMKFILQVIFIKIVSKVVIIKKIVIYWWLLIIIVDYYWWLLLMIIEKECDKINFSSNIIEVIRSVLNFFYDKFYKCQKAPKSIKKHLSGKN